MTTVNIRKEGGTYFIEGKPFNVTTFNQLRDSNIVAYKSSMKGELWQECEVCNKEPVCVNCMKCERHCTCGGGGWIISEKGIDYIKSIGYDVNINGLNLTALGSIANVKEALAEKREKEKSIKESERMKKVTELEAKGITLDERKFNALRDNWLKDMEHLGWSFSIHDLKIVKELESLKLQREGILAREPSDITKYESIILDLIPSIVVKYGFYDMEGFGQDAWYAPKEIVEKVIPILEEKRKIQKLKEEKERAEIEAKYKIEREEREKKEREARACREMEQKQKKALLEEKLSQMTKNEMLDQFKDLLNKGIIRKSWSKDELIKAILNPVEKKKSSRGYREGPDFY